MDAPLTARVKQCVGDALRKYSFQSGAIDLSHDEARKMWEDIKSAIDDAMRADLAAQMTVQAAAQVLLNCHTVQTMTEAGKALDLVSTLRALAKPAELIAVADDIDAGGMIANMKKPAPTE